MRRTMRPVVSVLLLASLACGDDDGRSDAGHRADAAHQDATSGDATIGDAGSDTGRTPLELDPALHEGPGPSGCVACESDRPEFPIGTIGDTEAPSDVVVPEPPRIERVLRMSQTASATINDATGEPTGPSLPAFRTTTDGRVALRYVGNAPSVSAMRLDGLRARPLALRETRLHLNAMQDPVTITGLPAHALRDRPGVSGRDAAFCAEDQSPRPCASDPTSDCYNVQLVQEWQCGESGCPSYYASIPIRIEVRDPRTAGADVRRAYATGDWTVSTANEFHTFETMVTADGRFMVFRMAQDGIGRDHRFVRDDGSIHQGHYSLAYTYTETPCDVREWFRRRDGAYANVRPLAAAHYDRRLRARSYGFAAYPLRDAFGAELEETDLVTGSYPWVDRHGNNVVWSNTLPVGIRELEGRKLGRFPWRREYRSTGGYRESRGGASPRGFSVAGSWTQGKMIMFDGRMNNEDYGILAGDTTRLGLYATTDGRMVSARVDGNSNSRAYATPETRGNTQHIESLENTFNMHPGMRPQTARDVVWTFSRGDFLQEFAFDDALDPHVLVFAPMTGAWRLGRQRESADTTYTRRGDYRDGFTYEPAAERYTHDAAAIRFQNAAATRSYEVPASGRFLGDGRLEPVAHGGVEGRGAWLEPESAIAFPFPDEATPHAAYYLGVFIDVRAELGRGRRLMALDLLGGGTLEVSAHPGGIAVHHVGEGRDVRSFPLPAEHPYRSDGWHHVGVRVDLGGEVEVFVDGNPVGLASFGRDLPIGGGSSFVIAGTSDDGAYPGVRGWVDEARLVSAGAVAAHAGSSALAGPASIELLCNYARGTTVTGERLGRWTGSLQDVADARAAALGVTEPVACATRYDDELAIGTYSVPEGTRAMRSAILERAAGDAALFENAPRPDTRANAFCLTCHVDASRDEYRPPALQLEALAPGVVHAPEDPRVQPMQPFRHPGQPAVVSGFVPAGWIEGWTESPQPATDTSVPRGERFPILRWMLPTR